MIDRQRREGSWYARRELWATGLVLLVALGLRWPFPEPQWMHVDERAFILYPLGFWSGDLNPHFFNYPTLPLYLSSAVYYLYFLLFSREPFAPFLAYRYFVEANDLLAIARGLTTIMAVGTVAVSLRLGRRLYGPLGGLLAGLFLALMPLHVRFSHLAITDVPAAFFASLAALWALRIYQEGRRTDFLLAGVFVGLAGSSKYPAALAAVPVLAAALLRAPTLRSPGLWSAGAAAVLTFGLTTPYAWLDPTGFWADFAGMGKEHLFSPSHGSGKWAWLHHLRYNLRYGLGLAGLATVLAALVWNPRGWRREEGVLVAGIAGFGALLVLAESVFMRYALPLAPLLAALMVRPLLARRRAVLGVWLVLLLAEPAYASLHIRFLLSGPDTRLRACAWLLENEPEGRRLLQLPKAAGQVPVLKPVSIFVRPDSFIESFGVEAYAQTCRVLSEREELPPFYVEWNFEQFKSIGDPPPEGAPDSILVIWYDHPLCGRSREDSLAREELAGKIRWESEFSPGSVEDAVFDQVDWFFVPIGGWGGIEETGPAIRIGKLPVNMSEDTPTAQDFFAVQHHLLAGNQAAQRGEWARAIQHYERIVESDFFLNELLTISYIYKLYVSLGVSRHKLGDAPRAIQTWEVAAGILPKKAPAYYNLGLVYDDLQDYDKAVHYYLQAAEFDPDNPDILYDLGVSYLKLHENDQAIAVLEKSLALRSAADAYINLGIAYGRTGQTGRARECFGKVLEVDPEHPQAAAIRQNLEKQEER